MNCFVFMDLKGEKLAGLSSEGEVCKDLNGDTFNCTA